MSLFWGVIFRYSKQNMNARSPQLFYIQYETTRKRNWPFNAYLHSLILSGYKDCIHGFFLVVLKLMIRLSAFTTGQTIQTWRRLMTPTPRRFIVLSVQPFTVFSRARIFQTQSSTVSFIQSSFHGRRLTDIISLKGHVLKRSTQNLVPYNRGGS